MSFDISMLYYIINLVCVNKRCKILWLVYLFAIIVIMVIKKIGSIIVMQVMYA